MRGGGVIEVGEGRHPGGFVPRRVKLKRTRGAIRGVDRGIEFERVGDGRVVIEQTARGKSKLSENEVVFEEIADIAPVIGIGVLADGFLHRFPQHAAQYPLVSKLAAKRRDSPLGGVLHRKVHAKHVATVIIMVGIPARYIGSPVSDKLKLIVMATPVNTGR